MADENHTVAGWTLIATLRHRPGSPTSVQPAHPGEPLNAEAWSRSQGWCEHCRTRRARRTTYLLRNVDGRLVQVGSSCLAAFIGHANPLRILRPPQGRAGRRRPGVRARPPADYIETRFYLAQVAQAIFDSGFVSTSSGSGQRPATWRQAAAALGEGRGISDRAQQRAEQTLQWIREELVPQDDFEGRLVAVAGRDRLTPRELPTAAAGIYAYHNHLRRQIAARKRAEQVGRAA